MSTVDPNDPFAAAFGFANPAYTPTAAPGISPDDPFAQAFAPSNLYPNDPFAQAYGNPNVPAQNIPQSTASGHVNPVASNPTNDRYGTDLSWLDPSFQTTPAMLGNAQQAYIDPNAIAKQNQTFGAYQQMANTPLQFASPQQQQDMYGTFGGVAGGSLNPTYMGNGAQQGIVNSIGQLQNPTYASPAQQQQVLSQVQGLKGPQFGSSADQTNIMDQLGSIARSGGNQGITLDNGQRQGDQYNNLDEIIGRGGLTANQVAARQGQRADEEQWLRSQREADQQQAAARGMSGSGSSLLALGQDRQASAGRNSLADLQSAAQAETNRLGAIGQAGTLAGQMRQQTNADQFGLAARGDSALLNQGNMANTLRQNAYQEGMGTSGFQLDQTAQEAALANTLRQQQAQEQQYNAGFGLDKLGTQGQITGQMRSQSDQEAQYNAQLQFQAMQQQANLANQLRSDQYNETMGQANTTLGALNGQSGIANNMAGQSLSQNQWNAGQQNQFSQLNQSAFNTAQQNNAAFLQNSYQSMMNNRQQWQINNLNQGINVATGLQNTDYNNNVAGFNQGTGLAQDDAAAFNQAQTNRNGALMGANGQTSAQVLNANYANNAAGSQPIVNIGQMADTFVSAGTGGPGAAGGAAKAPTGGASQAGVGGSGFANAGGGAINLPSGGGAGGGGGLNGVLQPYGQDPSKRVYG